jgi:hypothetical protein
MKTFFFNSAYEIVLVALELATEEARQRYYSIGTQLIFLDDSGISHEK